MASSFLFPQDPEDGDDMPVRRNGIDAAIEAHLTQIFRQLEKQKTELDGFRVENNAQHRANQERMDKLETIVQTNVNQMTLWRGIAKGSMWVWGGIVTLLLASGVISRITDFFSGR